MIKGILKLLAILVIGILIYNYFLGTESEKESSKKIFGEIKDVGVEVKELLKSEKEKFDKGKYDKAVEKVGDMLQGLKEKSKDIDAKYIDRIDELEQKKEELRHNLSQYSEADEGDAGKKDKFRPGGSKDSSSLKRELDDLLRQTEELIREMGGNK